MTLARRSNIAVLTKGAGRSAPQKCVPATSFEQAYLDALPLAAAILAITDSSVDLIAANVGFMALDRLGNLLGDAGIKNEIRKFIACQGAPMRFDWFEGNDISGRHYAVMLAWTTTADTDAPRCLITLVDRTAAVDAERSLRSEMLRDSLTGLPNRTAFIEAVDNAIARDDGVGNNAVLIVDLLRFSRVNESMGAIAGDELIITVARRLVSALRSGDVLARMAGDEFGILLNLTDGAEDAIQAARRIHTALLTPFRLSDLEIRIDAAIGYSLTSDAVTEAEDLVRYAQVALKRAKQSGRVEIYQPGEVAVVRRRFSLETELRRSIENGDLKLAYQPLIDLQNDRIAGFEALARWDHPDYGSVSPTDFVSVAEECGLIVPLGRWAITEATRTLAEWDRAAGKILPLYVGVNVSAVQLVRDDIASAARNALELSGLDGSRLMLELTESAIIGDPERSSRLLHDLKALNATIAMDDFGTGYSSLAYLQRLPIDVLKIDRSFVSGMIGDRDSIAIVRAILSLASALGMHTTAEGVETADLANMLAALGCSYGQGFYYSRPLSPNEAFNYCRRFQLLGAAA